MSARVLAEQLGAERGAFDLETAIAALESYQSGRSSRMAQRESGVPEKTIDRWVALLGIKRTREQANQIKSAALSSGRQLSAEVRRTVRAL